MKNTILLLSILIVALGSCCKKGPLAVPNFRIIYPELKQNTTVNKTVFYHSESTEQFGTILFEGDVSNYEFHLSTSSQIKAQIIDVFAPSSDSTAIELLFTDTISNVILEYGGRCDLDIVEFKYVHNSEVKTDRAIIK